MLRMRKKIRQGGQSAANSTCRLILGLAASGRLLCVGHFAASLCMHAESDMGSFLAGTLYMPVAYPSGFVSPYFPSLHLISLLLCLLSCHSFTFKRSNAKVEPRLGICVIRNLHWLPSVSLRQCQSRLHIRRKLNATGLVCSWTGVISPIHTCQPACCYASV